MMIITIMLFEFQYSAMVERKLAYNELNQLQALYLAKAGARIGLLRQFKELGSGFVGTVRVNLAASEKTAPLGAGDGGPDIRVLSAMNAESGHAQRANSGHFAFYWDPVNFYGTALTVSHYLGEFAEAVRESRGISPVFPAV